MARSAPAIYAFNSGELSPRMAGRVDQARYNMGCHRLENFIPSIPGPAIKRGGTYFVAQVKDMTKRAWLVRFEFSAAESFILEFGHQYIRFYQGYAAVLSGTPYEVVTPYTEADLVNADGGFAISFVQSGDIVYLAHRSHKPRKLSRFATTNWTLTEYDPTGGPFEDMNIAATTVYASANTGVGITLTASAAIFTSDHIGTLFYLGQRTVIDVEQWEPGKSITAGDIRRSGGRNYEAENTASTGTVTPTHTEGSVFDGDAAVQWTFLDAGYGWARITAIGGGGTTATATVLSRIPNGAVGSGEASTKWAFGAWSAANGWPDSVTFYLDRLCFARGSQVWMSVAGDYENMQATDFGRQTTESAIALPIPSRRGNEILWLETLEQGLVAGTGADEWLIGPASRNDPLGPLNVACNPLGAVGSRRIPVLRGFDSIIFTQRSGKKLRTLGYLQGEGAIRSDLNAYADHITPGLVSLAQTAEPFSIIWGACTDGTLVGALYYPEQEALGWARFPMDGVVECVQTIPAPDGRQDDLWLIVRRTINGAVKRYVEFMKAPLADDGDQADAFYVDCGKTTIGTITTVTGLSHLDGKTVSVLADGATHPQRTVTGGEISLQVTASMVHVGLPFTAKLATMDLEAGARDGTSQGKMKRVHKATIRLDRTLGGKAGPSETRLDTLQFRDASVPMGSPPPLFTGDKPVPWPGGSDKVARVWFVHDDPTPCTVVAIFPQLATEDA
jgi:hypothetical protein